MTLLYRLGWFVLALSFFGLGLWLRGVGPVRRIYLGGRLLPYRNLQSDSHAQVYFPRLGLFFDFQGRLWRRDQNGFVQPAVDPQARYRSRIERDGLVTLELSLTSWGHPGPCTIRFSQPGAATRVAREVKLSGPWRTLSGRFGDLGAGD
ncbi:MAG: hypothetical protein KF760_18905 [Candidatus Eremiobacteraeota bacterium]|nr:hypothetical protein [Candidatus Eremiobacteraeota bacterium]MCW5868469.1 hypothetical protein [Candidatus Eremiobacteraeota bacterium]